MHVALDTQSLIGEGHPPSKRKGTPVPGFQYHYNCCVPRLPLGFIKPELPTLVPEPPSGEGWIHEIKYDGYRTLIVIDRGQARALTRNGNDWRAGRGWRSPSRRCEG